MKVTKEYVYHFMCIIVFIRYNVRGKQTLFISYDLPVFYDNNYIHKAFSQWISLIFEEVIEYHSKKLTDFIVS